MRGGAQRHGGVVVGSAGSPDGMGLQGEAVGTQEAENALGVDRVWSTLPPRGPCDALVLEGDEQAAAVGRWLVDTPVPDRQELGLTSIEDAHEAGEALGGIRSHESRRGPACRCAREPFASRAEPLQLLPERNGMRARP